MWDDTSAEVRGTKVDAIAGRTKAGLPEDKGNWATDNWDEKPESIVCNAKACKPKVWLETPPSEHEVMDELTAQSVKPEFPGQFACKTGTCSAVSACLTACTLVARNSGEG